MPTECCVPRCTNRSGHAFPWSDPARMKVWMVAIKRDQWQPTKHSIVCKEHFDEHDYEKKTASGTTPLQKRLTASAVPHIFAWSKEQSATARSRQSRANKRLRMEEERDIERTNACHHVGSVVEVTGLHTDMTSCYASTEVQTDRITTAGVGTQTGQRRQLYCCTDFMSDPEGIHFYTGLENYEKFVFVLDTLGPAAHCLNYFHGAPPDLPVEDQFFMTLIKLRQHKVNFELGRMFGITEQAVSNVFITWISFMSAEWGEQDWWPSRDLTKFYAPTDFRSKFPSTRVIVDGTECPVMKPKEPIAQQSTYSTYKNRNTVKVLVGTTPGGLTSYVSPAYGGSTSDRQICERSNLRDRCDPGDSIMADKGFNVQDLFESKMITINIPTFFRKKNRLSAGTVLKDRKIASKRVHVERIIGLAKTYKILKEPMNNTESALATQIIQVCFSLCNFRPCIVPSTA